MRLLMDYGKVYMSTFFKNQIQLLIGWDKGQYMFSTFECKYFVSLAHILNYILKAFVQTVLMHFLYLKGFHRYLCTCIKIGQLRTRN